MEDTKIEFETARLAKEKGFPQDLFNTSWYNEFGTEHGSTDLNENGEPYLGRVIPPELKEKYKIESFSVPKQALLQKWLRDEYKIFVEINTDCTTYPKFCFDIKQFIGNPKNLLEKEWGWSFPVHNERWELERTYEEALEVGLQEALKLIK